MMFERIGDVKKGLQIGLWNKIRKQVDEINRNGSFFRPILKVENERIMCCFIEYVSYNIFLNGQVSHMMYSLKRPIEFIGDKNSRLVIGGACGFPSGTSFKTKTLYIEHVLHGHTIDMTTLDFDVQELFVDLEQLNEKNLNKLKNLNCKVFIKIKHKRATTTLHEALLLEDRLE